MKETISTPFSASTATVASAAVCGAALRRCRLKAWSTLIGERPDEPPAPEGPAAPAAGGADGAGREVPLRGERAPDPARQRGVPAREPRFLLPPKHLAFDAYSAPAWRHYKESGEETARFLAETISRHLGRDAVRRLLDWGCGPGRVIRHLPALLGPSVLVWGSDFDPGDGRMVPPEPGGSERPPQLPAPAAPVRGGDVRRRLLDLRLHPPVGALERRVDRRAHAGGASGRGPDLLHERPLPPPESPSGGAPGVRSRGGGGARAGFGKARRCSGPSTIRGTCARGCSAVSTPVARAPGGFPHVDQDLWVARKPQ